jgi:PAS domain S-box-containing protein
LGKRVTVDRNTKEHSLSDSRYSFKNLVDIDRLRSIFERFSKATGFTTGLVSFPEQELLIRTGWRDICTKFHRACPLSETHCKQSNLELTSKLKSLEELNIRPCENGLVDGATPIIVDGVHLASLFTGQVLFEKPDIERFKKQAEDYDYNPKVYLEALSEVPVVSEDKFLNAMAFLCNMAVMLAEAGLRELRLLEMEKERMRAEKALKESERKYRLLADNLTDVIWSLDMDFKYTYVSPSVEYLRGYTPEEALQIPLEQSFTPVSYHKVIQTFSKEIKRDGEAGVSPNRSVILELDIIHKDGGIIPVEVNASFLRNETGSPTGIIGITRDITDRKQADEERKKLQNQLNQAQKMEAVGRLAGGVAHDFNNMLSVIVGYTDLVMVQAEPIKPVHTALQEIRKAALQSASVTRQLLAFARKQTIAPQVIDLNTIVESMLKMLHRLIGEDIDLAWLPTTDLWPVRVDPSQIDQILANLCINARDAIAGVGKTTIETNNVTFDEAYCADHLGLVPGDFVLLAVSDDGCGMDKQTLDNVFDPFFTTKELDKGTGLGLATVYGIVKQNDGFINVYSEPEQGTIFKIYFPRIESAYEPGQKKSPVVPDTLGNATILLVEDELSILEMTTIMLKQFGYTVLAALTPREAIQIAREHAGEIHLLMTDVVMPEMNGLELARNLLSLYPNLKRLFMSGYTANVIAHHGVLDPGVHFIQKPFSMEDIFVKVRETLRDAENETQE